MAKTVTRGATQSLSREEVLSLIIKPMRDASVVARIVGFASTSQDAARFVAPIFEGISAASFVAEGAAIPLGEASLSEVSADYRKLAVAFALSNEVARGSNGVKGALTSQIGVKLAQGLDRALLAGDVAETTSTLPTGESVTGVAIPAIGEQGVTEADATVATLADAVIDADILARNEAGSALGGIIVATELYGELAKAAAVDELGRISGGLGSLKVSGVPVYESADVADGTALCLPKSGAIALGGREKGEVQSDTSVYFMHDAIAIRATTWVAAAYPAPTAITSLTVA